jgi:hypothetical protein
MIARTSCAAGLFAALLLLVGSASALGAERACARNEFVAGGKCFAAQKEACASLACGECKTLETAPAQVKCAAEKAGATS